MSVVKVCLLIGVLSLGLMQECWSDTRHQYQSLFRLPVEQQALEFKKYSLEQQIDVYLEAMQGVEPPATQFAGFLASNGSKVLPLLLRRLKEEKRDPRRYYYIRVFEEIHRDYCNLKEQEEVIEAIKQTISQIRDAIYADLCESSLKIILEQVGANSSC